MQVKNEESLLLLASYTKYSRKTHSQTVSTIQVGQPPSNLPQVLVYVRFSIDGKYRITYSGKCIL